jgi:uncharacterized protein YyaL (SSP411 family)
VRSSAGQIAARLADNAAASLPPAGLDAEALEAAVQALVSEFDVVNGGFGGAPKFPPSMTLEFLLRHHERTGSGQALHLATATAGRMARGGMYDQLAGGFARYSVDARWIVPHFEKMLYDNALLLRVYAHLARIAGPHAALARRVAEETAEFLLRDLHTPQGGFASALDADTDGVEGLTYAWTPAELTEVLGEKDGAWAAELLAVTPEGTFEHGSSTLQLPTDPDDPARWRRIRPTLLAARNRRPQPARDDKVVTAWNGMAVLALAEAGAALGRPEWVSAADATADLLLERHVVDGRVRRSSRNGTAGAAAGVLEDHAFLAEALLALHQATGAARRLERAVEVLDLTLAHFADPVTSGAFFDTADDAEALLHRPREITDNATPSGAAALAGALLTASVLVDDPQRYRAAAEAALRTAGGLARQFPRFAGHWLTVAEAAARGPLQVAVVGVDTDRDALAGHARAIAPGGTVVVGGSPDAPGVPLLAHRPLVDGAAAAYVCRGFVCDRPVTTVEELTAALLLTP